MLLKWLFTLLAILWLYQAIRPFFASIPPPRQTPPSRGKSSIKQREVDKDEDDYIDYEEIK